MPGCLFQDELGASMSTAQTAFSLDHRIPESIVRMIQMQGGRVSAFRGANVLHLMPFAPGVEVSERERKPVYSDSFVYDSVREHQRQSLDKYELKVKERERRHSYTSDEEGQIHEYVKANDTPRKAAPGYWENVKQVLRLDHSPESMRYHYLRHLSKVDIAERRKSPKDYFDKLPVSSPSKPALFPLKRSISMGKFTAGKVTKQTSSATPLPSISEEPDADPLSSSLSDLSLSACKLQITSYQGKREVQKVGADQLSELEIMRRFGRLTYICRKLTETELSMREVLRTLVHFKGNVKATVHFYAPLPS